MPSTSGPSSHDKTAPQTLFAVAAATMLSLIVFTVPLTTLGSIATTLPAGPGAQAWIMSGMPVGAAAGLLGLGAIGDTYGRRRTFLAGLAIVAVSSIGGALAPTAPVLIAARLIQGVGSAALLACGLGLIGQVFVESGARARAAAIWASALGAGVAIGPIVAALLLPIGGWQAAHWLIAVMSLFLLQFGRSAIVPDEPFQTQKVDLAGMAVLAAAMILLLSALTESRIALDTHVWALFATSMALTMVFIAVENRARNPILQLGLFRRPDFIGATLGAFASGAGVLSIMTMVPMLLEQGLDMAPTWAAIILTAWSATTAIAALAIRPVLRRVPPRWMLVWSMIGCAAGQGALLLVTREGGFPRVLPGLFIAGVANGFLNASLGHQSLQSVPADRTAMGSAANNTARYLGSAVGITFVTIMMTHGAENGIDGLFGGWQSAVLLSVGVSLAGAAISAATGGRPEVPHHS